MKAQAIAAALIVSIVCSQAWAQASVPGPAQVAAPAQANAAPTPAAEIVVPIGTVIPLNLVNAIKSKSSPPGSTVRAMVVFPVTVGNQLAIPAGTYVEGTLVQSIAPKTKKKVKGSSSAPVLQVHFTKLLYANGYTVTLDAVNTAGIVDPAIGSSSRNEVAMMDQPEILGEPSKRVYGPSAVEQLDDADPQQAPTLPSLGTPGPNPAVVVGASLGGTLLLFTVGVLLLRHKAGTMDTVLYDAGLQLEMTTSSPLTLDRAQVMGAAAVSAPNPAQ